MNRKQAFMIAGTQSGCGKTTVALGVMAALKSRGFHVQPFKVGPDFIDPGFHTRICGTESRNLDGWMLSRSYNRALFGGLLGEADVAVVEGVMGLYDGYDGLTEAGSSAEMAKWLDIPVVLVVDARSMARSAAALIKGFRDFDPMLSLAGVIFNRIGGEGHLEYLKEAMSMSVPDVPVLGGIPREEIIRIPERHLGLVTVDETPLDRTWRDTLVDLVERNVDLDLVLSRSTCREGFPERFGPEKRRSDPVRPIPIAVARDAAFCFYYPDNLELLRRAGAELYLFSPVAGETFPKGVGGVYLGGGYPELFAERISECRIFLESLRSGAKSGMPIHAECGGLMTLGRFIDTVDGKRFPMAGLLPFGTRMLSRRKALGYTEVVLREPCLLGEPGTAVRGHEFHYSEITDAGDNPALRFAYELRARKHQAARSEGYMTGSVLASYVHLHWGSEPSVPEAFVRRCGEYLRRTGGA